MIRRRNAVFTLIYRKVTLHYPQYVPKAARRLLEVTFLLMVRFHLNLFMREGSMFSENNLVAL